MCHLIFSFTNTPRSQVVATCIALNTFTHVFRWCVNEGVLYVDTDNENVQRVINALGNYGFRLIEK